MKIPRTTTLVASIENCFAVLGAAKRYTPAQLELGYRVGAAIGKAGKFTLTGATTGIPHAAAVGAVDHGGFVIGISPATNPSEHVQRYLKPLDSHHFIIYTGMGNDGRSPLIVRSASVALVIGGEAGTLQEFTSAWLNGTPIIGVLLGSGGIADELPRLAASFTTSFGSQIITASTPEELVAACITQQMGIPHRNKDQPDSPLLASIAHLRPKII